ncbi:MAG: hypothetical protein HYZ81_24480 [Nitrospinae bacterium]|nr:hypothetical protein [Nitrospinota bacterium]
MLLRVERNANCINLEPTELQEVSPPVEISRVRVRWKDMPAGSETLVDEFVWADVWGWSSQESGSPCPAYAQRVIDPEGDEGIVIYGGDWGVKLWVKEEEIGRNILWTALDTAHENLPPDIAEQLGLGHPSL